jgi:hypothetical protein
MNDVALENITQWLEVERDYDALLSSARGVAYRFVYARRAMNGEDLPSHADDPLIAELQREADLELYLQEL